MHFTLLVAGALIPGELAVPLSATLNTPSLKARLARAASVETAAAGNAHFDWLAHELFKQNAPAPTAPYAFAQLSGVASSACIWHADPVHVEIARDHLILQSLDTDVPAEDESRQLIKVANELASDLGCEFVIAGERWFLLSERDWTIEAAPLAAMIDAPMMMPVGGDASIWNRLHNEIQMAWHAHSVNQARESRGQRTINGIWLHGGGRWKPLAPIRFASVQSDAPEWRGAAQATGAYGAPLSEGVIDNALLVLDAPLLPKRREDWTAWFAAMTAIDRRLAAHSFDAVDLVFTGTTIRTFASRPSDRYKIWRRRGLAEALAE